MGMCYDVKYPREKANTFGMKYFIGYRCEQRASKSNNGNFGLSRAHLLYLFLICNHALQSEIYFNTVINLKTYFIQYSYLDVFNIFSYKKPNPNFL